MRQAAFNIAGQVDWAGAEQCSLLVWLVNRVRRVFDSERWVPSCPHPLPWPVDRGAGRV